MLLVSTTTVAIYNKVLGKHKKQYMLYMCMYYSIFLSPSSSNSREGFSYVQQEGCSGFISIYGQSFVVDVNFFLSCVLKKVNYLHVHRLDKAICVFEMAEQRKAIKRLEYVGKSLIKLFIEDCFSQMLFFLEKSTVCIGLNIITLKKLI